MADEDKELRQFFEKLAKASGSTIAFKAATTADVSKQLSLSLPLARNGHYVFDVQEAGQPKFTCVAYTNLINSTRRSSTRADHLGKGLAVSDGKLLDYNPFLIVYDFIEKRVMAVSAVALFRTFAKAAGETDLETPDYGFFSMTPHFGNRTINMYGDVPETSVQNFSLGGKDKLDKGGLLKLLKAIQSETKAARATAGEIVEAIQSRLSKASKPAAMEVGVSDTGLTLDFDEASALAPDDFLVPTTDGDRSVIEIAVECLQRGHHLIFYGPPGTGKTTLARALARAITSGKFLVATATADWSAFETLGGYAPAPGSPGELTFSPGLFLRCFVNSDTALGTSARWLILDEVNRADIDKIFGPAFGILAGQGGTLPFLHQQKTVEVLPEHKAEGPQTSNMFVVPKTWRLIATMNTHDKASLFQLSYAFMRRFAWIYVGLPNLGEFLATRGSGLSPDRLALIEGVWEAFNTVRLIGPSIWADVLKHVGPGAPAEELDWRLRLLEGISLFVVPQFEGADAPTKTTALETVTKLIQTGLDDAGASALDASLERLRSLVLEVF